MVARKAMSRPRVRLRIVFAAARWLGPGKVDLLEAVARTGSLTRAADACGMSYKRAWGLLKAADEIFGVPLVAMTKGGRGGGGGAAVTATGVRVIKAYRRAERAAGNAAARAFERLPAAGQGQARHRSSRRRGP